MNPLVCLRVRHYWFPRVIGCCGQWRLWWGPLEWKIKAKPLDWVIPSLPATNQQSQMHCLEDQIIRCQRGIMSDAELLEQIKVIICHNNTLAPILEYFNADPTLTTAEMKKFEEYSVEEGILF
ncbi:hypothetical protein FRB95_010511 [Tulasnella sp. JGI-2019a]|nr:hypothetical protein FRB95_010511 [Tulasnella sp. JGI-2019a]